MSWLVRVSYIRDSVKHLIQEKPNEVLGTTAGTTGGIVGQWLYNDWGRPILLAVMCAVGSLLVSHYGKKILRWIDSKLDL